VRIQKAHQFNDDIRVLLPFFFVFDREDIFDHALDVAAILPHYQVVPRCIVFHYYWYLGNKCKHYAEKRKKKRQRPDETGEADWRRFFCTGKLHLRTGSCT
jgi:hypothetical protein